ncbi:MAG: DUF4349 domain-containing protein [Tissierellia bacterium]|nr:DUF4349 domain-containing protein [Tissierellia bacterium]
MKKLFAIVLALAFLTGCSSNLDHKNEIQENSYEESYSAPASDEKYDDFMDDEVTPMEAQEDIVGLEPEKVIVIVNIEFETTDIDKSIESIENVAKVVKGYIEDSSIEFGRGYSGGYKSANYSIRVPKENVEEFKRSISSETGTIVSESTSRSDVTKNYRDTKTRLEVLEEKEKRLRELLANAEDVETMIKIEDSLADTVSDKEILKSDLLNIDDKVDYSTINIWIKEVKQVSNVETTRTSYPERLKNAITGSFEGFVIGLGNIIINLIYMLPYIVLLIILFLLIRFIFRKLKPKMRGFRKKSKDREDVKDDEDR